MGIDSFGGLLSPPDGLLEASLFLSTYRECGLVSLVEAGTGQALRHPHHRNHRLA